ncbi:MAG: hypothetical protein AAF740_02875 [Bacteroidota bacterium]
MKKPKTFAQKAKSFLLKFLVVILILALGGGYVAYNANFSDGFRSGVIQKISHKGMVFKTYEGQMDIGGLQATNNGQMSSVFDFSVEGNQKQILKMLEDVSATGERVKVKYEEKYFTFPWRGDTKYFIVEVERLDDKQKVDEAETTPESTEETPTEEQPEEETEGKTEESTPVDI